MLKTNISIRAKGFDWEWAHHPWSKDGRNYTVKELAKHLRKIITKEKNLEIPTEPKTKLPQRHTLGVLGTPTDFVKTLDEKYLSEDIRQGKIDNESGKKSIYARMQPFEQTNISDLLNRRIDVQFALKVEGKPVMKWCQGEVVGDWREKEANSCCPFGIQPQILLALRKQVIASKFSCQANGIRILAALGAWM